MVSRNFNSKIVVIGGGLAGLTISARLLQLGYKNISLVAPKNDVLVASKAAAAISSMKGATEPRTELFKLKMDGHLCLPSFLREVEGINGQPISSKKNVWKEYFRSHDEFERIATRVFNRGGKYARDWKPFLKNWEKNSVDELSLDKYNDFNKLPYFLYGEDLWINADELLESLAACVVGEVQWLDGKVKKIDRRNKFLSVEFVEPELKSCPSRQKKNRENGEKFAPTEKVSHLSYEMCILAAGAGSLKLLQQDFSPSFRGNLRWGSAFKANFSQFASDESALGLNVHLLGKSPSQFTNFAAACFVSHQELFYFGSGDGKNTELSYEKLIKKWEDFQISQMGNPCVKTCAKHVDKLMKNCGDRTPNELVVMGKRLSFQGLNPVIGYYDNNHFICTGLYKSGFQIAPVLWYALENLLNRDLGARYAYLQSFAPKV